MKNSNFKFNVENTSSDIIEKIDVENNTIYFNQLTKGTNIVLELPVIFNHEENFDINNFNKESSIVLAGNYKTEQAKDIGINKEIKLKINWTSEVKVKLEQSLTKYTTISQQTVVNGEKEAKEQTLIQTVIKTKIEDNSMPVK